MVVGNKILIVEDNEKYRSVAAEAFSGKNFEFATDYDSAISKVSGVDFVVSDVCFPQNSRGTSKELSDMALEHIKTGLIGDYVGDLCERVKSEAGLVATSEMIESFKIMAYHNLGAFSDYTSNSLQDSIVLFARCFGEDCSSRLRKIISEMYIESVAERTLYGLFGPLETYMGESPANQPLGYLMAEEAERLGKPFALVTSLRHSEAALVPILKSAKTREWKVLEGGDGSKETSEFWEKARVMLEI